MRIVAVILALLVLPVAFPAVTGAPNDACADQVPHNKPCKRIDLDHPAVKKTYYVYLAAAECASKFGDSTCRGEGSGDSTLPGGDFWGFVYEETNRYPGLQRYPAYLDGIYYKADTMVIF